LSTSGSNKSTQAFRTIAEASDELDLPAHVLRFWEGKFTQIKPLKRAGGRRHYRPDDMALLRGIRALLQEDGYQLKGVQKLLRDHGIAWVRQRGMGVISDGAMGDDDDLPSIATPLHQRADPQLHAQSGPLFEASVPLMNTEAISPSAGVLLRQALVKLQRAHQILDNAAKVAPR
jgi:MerR HTH family regulatory protein